MESPQYKKIISGFVWLTTGTLSYVLRCCNGALAGLEESKLQSQTPGGPGNPFSPFSPTTNSPVHHEMPTNKRK